MGKFNKGILGSFTGKVGNIIGSKWKGISYMRSLSDVSSRPPTEKQIIVRARFAFASKFLQALGPVIKIGFKGYEKKQSPQNAAMSEFINHAIKGDYPSYAADFEKLRIAKGTLEVAKNYGISLAGTTLTYSWEDNANSTKENGDNKAVLLALAEGFPPSYSIAEFTRDEKAATLASPSVPAGTKVYCYLFFYSDKEKITVCNSLLAGTVTTE